MSQEKLEEAVHLLRIINGLTQFSLQRTQIKKLIRYCERLQLNNIDGVQGDAYVVSKRKDASRLVNRIFSKLDVELKLLAEVELDPYLNDKQPVPKKIPLSYSIGVCIQQHRTVVSIVYNHIICLVVPFPVKGLFEAPSYAYGSGNARRFHSNGNGVGRINTKCDAIPLVDVMQNIFDCFVHCFDCGLLPELPAPQMITAFNKNQPNTSICAPNVIISTSSPSPLITDMMLLRAWKAMLQQNELMIQRLVSKNNNNRSNASSVSPSPLHSPIRGSSNPHEFFDSDVCLAVEHVNSSVSHEPDVQSQLLCAKNEISTCRVVHTHASVAALIAYYYSPASFALFRVVPKPMQPSVIPPEWNASSDPVVVIENSIKEKPVDSLGSLGLAEEDYSDAEFNADITDIALPETNESNCKESQDFVPGKFVLGTSDAVGIMGSGASSPIISRMPTLEAHIEKFSETHVHEQVHEFEESVIHVVVSVEDFVWYVSLLLVTTKWVRATALTTTKTTTVETSENDVGNKVHVRKITTSIITSRTTNFTESDGEKQTSDPSRYYCKSISDVRWIHHSSHCIRALYLPPAAASVMSSPDTNPMLNMSGSEFIDYIRNVWNMNVLHALCMVPPGKPMNADGNMRSVSHKKHNLNEQQDAYVAGMLKKHPLCKVHFVGMECGAFSDRYSRYNSMFNVKPVDMKSKTEESVQYVSSGNHVYTELQKYRHKFIRALEEFFLSIGPGVGADTLGISGQSSLHSFYIEQMKRYKSELAKKQKALALSEVYLHIDLDAASEKEAVQLQTNQHEHVIDGEPYLKGKLYSPSPLPIEVTFEHAGVACEAIGAALIGASAAKHTYYRVMEQFYNVFLNQLEDCAFKMQCECSGMEPINYDAFKSPEVFEDLASHSNTNSHSPVPNSLSFHTEYSPTPMTSRPRCEIPELPPIQDISGYCIGLRSSSETTAIPNNPSIALCGNNYDLDNVNISSNNNTLHRNALFFPVLTQSMELPASQTVRLKYYRNDMSTLTEDVTKQSRRKNILRFDTCLSSNISKYDAQTIHYSSIYVDEYRHENGDYEQEVFVYLTYYLSVNRVIEIQIEQEVNCKTSNKKQLVSLFERREVSYSPDSRLPSQVLENLEDSEGPVAQELCIKSSWICQDMAQCLKASGDFCMHESTKVMQVAESQVEGKGEDEESLQETDHNPDHSAHEPGHCNSTVAQSAQQEEAMRIEKQKQKHAYLLLALWYYSQALRYDPCNHLLLSNRCAALTHLQVSDRFLRGTYVNKTPGSRSANANPAPTSTCALFSRKTAIYQQNTYLFSALYDAKECIRYSNYGFGKGYMRLGAIYYQIKKYYRALDLYRHALLLEPSNASLSSIIVEIQSHISTIHKPPDTYIKSMKNKHKNGLHQSNHGSKK